MQSHNKFQTLMEMTPRKLFFFFLLTEIYIHEGPSNQFLKLNVQVQPKK